MARAAHSDEFAPRENFLYLLSEMEAAVERGGIIWAEGQATRACQRLDLITAQIGKITPQGRACHSHRHRLVSVPPYHGAAQGGEVMTGRTAKRR